MIHTVRPKSMGGRVAWDAFTKLHGKPPDRMWFCSLTYPVWVAQYGDEYDEFDNIELRGDRAKAIGR